MQIVAVPALLIYPFVAYIATRMLHVEGLDGDVGRVAGSLAGLLYPIGFALFFLAMGWSLLFIPPRVLLGLTVVTVALALSLSLGLFANALRGINESGYTIKPNAVYTDGRVLAGADPASFEVLFPESDSQRGIFARDAKRVYRWGRVLPGADPQTFALLEDREYTRDATHVFVEDRVVEGADGGTFEWLRHDGKITGYWRDKNAVYYREKRIPEANAATFALITDDYGHDGTRVFYDGDVLDGADAVTFRHLNGFVGKDASRVYFRAKAVLPDTDVARFTMRNASFGADDRYVYYFVYEEPYAFEADADTVEMVGEEQKYAKDKYRVYYLGFGVKVVEGADAASFKAVPSVIDSKISMFDGEDKNHRYLSGERFTMDAQSTAGS